MRRACARPNSQYRVSAFAAGIAITIAIALLSSHAARADGTHVRLRGSAHIDVHGARAEGEELLLDGTLRDDAGNAIGSEIVNVTLARSTEVARLLTFNNQDAREERRTTRSCVSGIRDRDPVKANGTILPIKTGDDGRFCVRVSLPIDRYVAHLAWSGSAFIDGTKVDLPIDLSRRAVVLRFDPEPRVLWINGSSGGIEALATIDDNGTTSLAADAPLTLSNERGAAIASATTNGSGRAHFMFDPSRLGPPGRGELRVAFGGNADSAAIVHVAEIERHTRVDLAVNYAEGDRLAPGSPEDGVAFVVTAKSAGGDVPNGSVEARAFGQLVGAGTVENGVANVVVTFSSEAASSSGSSGNEATIELKYAPAAPWYEPAATHVVHLPVRGPSPWRQLPLVLAGVGVVVWFVLGRTARRRLTTAPPRVPKAVSKGEAKIEIVRAAGDPNVGWSGSVIDAHDGGPVKGARVAIERPAFGRVETLGSAIADAYGRFELRATDAGHTRPGDELAIEAPLHGPLRKPMPPAGELEIALVLRKRALLARLVTWAKQRGRPFDVKPEPTPGQVRKSAGKDFTLVRWADAVERAAFGGGDVDARLEAEIDGLAPAALPPPASPAEEFAKLPAGESERRVKPRA